MIKEGKVRKGGVNFPPTTPRPSAPVGSDHRTYRSAPPMPKPPPIRVCTEGCKKAVNQKEIDDWHTNESPDYIEAEILKCKYCGESTVSVFDMARCPKGCPGNFSIIRTCKVPFDIDDFKGRFGL